MFLKNIIKVSSSILIIITIAFVLFQGSSSSPRQVAFAQSTSSPTFFQLQCGVNSHIFRPNDIAVVSSIEAGSAQTEVGNNACSNLTIGPNVTFRAILYRIVEDDSRSRRNLKHLKIFNTTSTQMFLHGIQFVETDPSFTLEENTTEKYPSFEMSRCMVVLDPFDTTTGKRAFSRAFSLVTSIKFPKYPTLATFSFFHVHDNYFNCNVVPAMTMWQSCVRIAKLSVASFFNFSHNTILSGYQAVGVTSVLSKNEMESSIHFNFNKIVVDGRFCTDFSICNPGDTAAEIGYVRFAATLEGINQLLSSDENASLIPVPSFLFPGYDPGNRVPTNQELARPQFTMSSNDIATIEEGPAHFSEGGCLALEHATFIPPTSRWAGRSILVQDNKIVVDYYFVTYGSRKKGHPDVWRGYNNSVDISGLWFKSVLFTSMFISISRNFINLTKCGSNKGIEFNDDEKVHCPLCIDTSALPSTSYNYFPTRQQKARMEISNNTIVLDGRTKFSSSTTQADGYLNQRSMALSFSGTMRDCDLVVASGNFVSLFIERPLWETGNVANIDPTELTFRIVTQPTFFRLLEVANIGEFFVAGNAVNISCVANSNYTNSLSFMNTIGPRNCTNLRSIVLDNNVATFSGSGHQIVFLLLEASVMQDLRQIVATRNRVDFTAMRVQGCSACFISLGWNPFLEALLKRKIAAQLEGFIVIFAAGSSSILVEDNFWSLTSSLSKDPQTGVTASTNFGIGESDQLLVQFVSLTTSATAFVPANIQVRRNLVHVLQNPRVDPLKTNLATVLEQSSTPFSAISIGPNMNENIISTTNIIFENNTIVMSTGRVDFFSLIGMKISAASSFQFTNNRVEKIGGALMNTNNNNIVSLRESIVRSVSNSFAHVGIGVEFLFQDMPARSSMFSFARVSLMLDSVQSSSASFIFRNNTFELRNSEESVLELISCVHANAMGTTQSSSYCFQSASAESSVFESNSIIFEKRRGIPGEVTVINSSSIVDLSKIGDNIFSNGRGEGAIIRNNSFSFFGGTMKNNNNNNQAISSYYCSMVTLATSFEDLVKSSSWTSSMTASISRVLFVSNNFTFRECQRSSFLHFASNGAPPLNFLAQQGQTTKSLISFQHNTLKTESGDMAVNSATTNNNNRNQNKVDDFSNTTSLLLFEASNSNMKSVKIFNQGNDFLNTQFTANLIFVRRKSEINPQLSDVANIISYGTSSGDNNNFDIFRLINLNISNEVPNSTSTCNRAVVSTNSGIARTEDMLITGEYYAESETNIGGLSFGDCAPAKTANNKNRTNSTTKTISIIGHPLPASGSDNHVLFVGTNVAQSIGIFASAAVSAVSPSLGFGVARQQAMVNFLQNMRDGDCSGISDPNEVAAADSPTQMKIGASDAKFYVGGAVGNTILSVCLVVAMQIGGTVALKFSGSSSWNRPFAVFARCNVALVFYVCASLLLAPTLTFGLVAVSVSNVENLSVGSKILAVIFSIVFVVATFYYSIWSLFLRPDTNSEKYRKRFVSIDDKTNSTAKSKMMKPSILIRVWNFWFEGEGEWMLPRKATVKEKLNFDAASPMFDGYNGRAKWFGLPEFVVQVGLALAPFFANLVPTEKSCVTTFAVLVVVFGGYLLLCFIFRPFQEKFSQLFIPIVTICQIAVIGVAFAYGDNPPDFIVALATFTVSLQSAMAVIVLVASFSPLMKHVLRAYRKVRRILAEKSKNKKGRSQQQKRNPFSLKSLVGEDDDFEEMTRRRNSTHDRKPELKTQRIENSAKRDQNPHGSLNSKERSTSSYSRHSSPPTGSARASSLSTRENARSSSQRQEKRNDRPSASHSDPTLRRNSSDGNRANLFGKDASEKNYNRSRSAKNNVTRETTSRRDK